jgi:hypothetical protein
MEISFKLVSKYPFPSNNLAAALPIAHILFSSFSLRCFTLFPIETDLDQEVYDANRPAGLIRPAGLLVSKLNFFVKKKVIAAS